MDMQHLTTVKLGGVGAPHTQVLRVSRDTRRKRPARLGSRLALRAFEAGVCDGALIFGG